MFRSLATKFIETFSLGMEMYLTDWQKNGYDLYINSLHFVQRKPYFITTYIKLTTALWFSKKFQGAYVYI
jgi:hypothetical protein